jgi:hypothetical protein
LEFLFSNFTSSAKIDNPTGCRVVSLGWAGGGTFVVHLIGRATCDAVLANSQYLLASVDKSGTLQWHYQGEKALSQLALQRLDNHLQPVQDVATEAFPATAGTFDLASLLAGVEEQGTQFVQLHATALDGSEYTSNPIPYTTAALRSQLRLLHNTSTGTYFLSQAVPYTLRDSQGRAVRQGSSAYIDTDGLAPGLYVVQTATQAFKLSTP